MIPVKEFLQIKPEHSDDGEKVLMFARINHELKEREELEKARQELLRKKQSLIADNQKRKDDLASLDKDLETFIDVGGLVLCKLPRMLIHHRLRNRSKRYSKKNTELRR